MRRAPTQAEQRLWMHLRKEQLGGFKFRRQAPLPPYIVDFLCIAQKLIIEIDGSTHGESHEIQYDEKRTASLEAKGYRVLRFWNIDIYNSIGAVLDAILLALQDQRAH